MDSLKNVYDNGELNIIQNVGYPNQNRSHFRSLDIWNSASGADEYLLTGWLGCYFDTYYPNYPNEDNTDPFAITIELSCSNHSAN